MRATVTARASASRKGHTDYYCGGDGCRRCYRLATFIPPVGSDSSKPWRGLLYAGYDFKEVDGMYRLVRNSSRARGRTVNWEAYKMVEKDPNGSNRTEHIALERAERARVAVFIDDPYNQHKFLCPDCDAVNVVPPPVDKARYDLDRVHHHWGTSSLRRGGATK